MVRIRLRRAGRRKAPMYRIVVAESTTARDGRFIENIGTYNPRSKQYVVNVGRATYWLDVGARPSETTRGLLKRAGVNVQRRRGRP